MRDHLAHYRSGYVLVLGWEGLQDDYDDPRLYRCLWSDMCGRHGSPVGRRLMVDHDATGTCTSGTGDTIMRRLR